jgi:uncharacterized protein YukE
MRIRVTPENLRSAAQQFWRMSDLMGRLYADINRADGYLDVGNLEGNVRARVERHLDQARRNANRFESEATEIARQLEQIAARFEAADQQNLQGMSWVSTQLPAAQAGYLPAAIGGTSALFAMGGIAGEGSVSAYPFESVPTGFGEFSPHLSSDLVALTREHKIWPERRGRPRDHHPSAKVGLWEGELWEAPENTGNTRWGGLRFGGETHAEAGAAEAGLKAELDDGVTIGPYVGVTAFAAGASGVIGSKDAGVAGGVGVKALEGEAFIGVKDGTVGAKIGGKIISAEGTVGGNVGGTYVGVVGGIGLEFELGIAIGKKTRIDLGPFTLGLDIGEALGA